MNALLDPIADEYLGRWATAYRTWGRYWGEDAARLLDWVPMAETPGCVALDLGCGQGRNIPGLLARGYTVHAVDMLPEAIEGLSFGDGRATLHCADAFDFLAKLADGAACFILANHLLQHLSSMEAALALVREMKRTVMPGGRIALAYFTGPADIHPHYVRDYAFLPDRGALPSAISDADFGIEYESWEIKLDRHDGDEHRHAIERLILVGIS